MIWYLLGGLAGGGLVVGGLAIHKSVTLQRRGEQLAAVLQGGGAAFETYMLAQGGLIETELEQLGRQEAERVAQIAGTQYLQDRYGLSPRDFQDMQRLYARSA